MKILITGGAGFIGSNFIHYWIDKYPEDKIINLDCLTYAANLDNLVKHKNNSNYKFIKGDICDEKLVQQIFRDEKLDLVIHFAAESHVDKSIKSSQKFIHTNVEGTRVLLDAALAHDKVRFHHISTDEVFGSLAPHDPPFNESTPYNPRNPYSASKAASDFLVRSYFHTHNLPITISNCSNNYGPYQFLEKFIPLSITNLLKGNKIGVYGDGKNIRDWIHVSDHNRGVEAIIRRGKIGETYCLGGKGEISNLDLSYKILEIMNLGKENIEFIADRPGHDLRYAMDYAKAKRELDWEPEIDFGEGLEQTIEWYRQNYLICE